MDLDRHLAESQVRDFDQIKLDIIYLYMIYGVESFKIVSLVVFFYTNSEMKEINETLIVFRDVTMVW